MTRPVNILALMKLCGSAFGGDSWAAWRVVLRAAFALPLRGKDLEIYRALTGRSAAPTAQARELWAIAGRRSGKSMIAALVAVFLTTCKRYRLAPGERGVFMVIAADRRQARVVRRYVGGLLNSTPALAQLVARETRESVELTNGITVEIHTASFRTTRGYTVVGAVCDEVAFWPTEDSAQPDREILAALRPAMATVPDALLICLSSPYAKRGELWRAHREHFGQDGDPVLVVKGATRLLNPTVDQAVIDRAFAEDAASAASEYDGEFRSDVESYVSVEAIESATAPERFELPPVSGVEYSAFVDPAGGSGSDSMTMAIGHGQTRDGRTIAVLDALRETRPPFSPEVVIAEFGALLSSYRVERVVGDRWGGEWVREPLRKAGIAYEPSERTKSELYRDLLPLLNSGAVELLDVKRLRGQLAGLERKTSRGGRDSIDHGPGANSHDDVANSVCGALVLAHQRAAAPAELLLVTANTPMSAEARRIADEARDVVSRQVIDDSIRRDGTFWPGGGGGRYW